MNLRIKEPNRFKKILKILFGFPLTLASFFFIFKIIFDSKDQISPNLHDVNKITLITGFIFLCLFFSIRPLIWNLILKSFGFDVNYKNNAYLYQKSEIKRYIPGNIFAFISRSVNYNQIKIPNKIIIKGLFIESFVMISSAAFLSIPSFVIIKEYFVNHFKFSNLYYLIIFMVFSIFIAFYRKFTFHINISKYIDYINLFIISSFAWSFFGVGNYLIASSFTYIDPINFLPISSVFVFAWLIGYLSIVTPMGLGVREGVVIVGLSHFTPLYLTSMIAVIQRIIFIISELIFYAISLFIYKFRKKFNTKVSLQFIIVVILSISYIIYFSYISFEKYANFFTGRFDLGNMDQTVWNTLHGRIFEFTNPDNVQTISRLAFHADFILILLSPLYLIWQDPRTLLFIQSLVLGIGAIFIYLLAKKIINDKNLSLVLSLSYLLNPFLQKQNLFDFHAVTLATTFLIAAYYFLINNKQIYFLLFLFLSVLTKENVFLISAIFGLFMFFQKKRSEGLLVFIFSSIAFYLLIAKFIPDIRGGEQHFALSYFSQFGRSPFEILINFITQPQITFSFIFTQENIEYMKKLFIHTGFISFLSPLYLIFSLPDLLIKLVSENKNFKSIEFHYAALTISFIYISSIYAIKKIIVVANFKFIKTILLYYLLFFAFYSTWEYGVLPGSKNPALEVFNKSYENREFVANSLKKIPQNLSVASTNNLGSHLSQREKIHTIPIGTYEADVVAFLLNDMFAQPSLADQIEMVNKLKKDPKYIKLIEKNDFVIFVKKEKKSQTGIQ